MLCFDNALATTNESLDYKANFCLFNFALLCNAASCHLPLAPCPQTQWTEREEEGGGGSGKL